MAFQYGAMIYAKDGQTKIELPFTSKPRPQEAHDDPLENLDREYEVLGLMVSGSPLKYKSDLIKKYPITPIADAKDSQGASLQIVGIIRSIRVINTRNGMPMAFVSVYDESGDIDITIFSKTYALTYQLLQKANIIRVTGFLDTQRENVFVANDIVALEE